MLPRTHQTPRSEKLSRVKFALICIAGISGIIGVYSSPAARNIHVGIIRTPTVPESDVERSVHGARSPKSLAASDEKDWACMVVNYLHIGFDIESTEAQA
jgi:hypothetical protein